MLRQPQETNSGANKAQWGPSDCNREMLLSALDPKLEGQEWLPELRDRERENSELWGKGSLSKNYSLRYLNVTTVKTLVYREGPKRINTLSSLSSCPLTFCFPFPWTEPD